MYLDICGWIELNDDTTMQLITYDDLPVIITIKEYKTLDPETRKKYILESATQAIIDAHEGHWETLEIVDEEVSEGNAIDEVERGFNSYFEKE